MKNLVFVSTFLYQKPLLKNLEPKPPPSRPPKVKSQMIFNTADFHFPAPGFCPWFWPLGSTEERASKLNYTSVCLHTALFNNCGRARLTSIQTFELLMLNHSSYLSVVWGSNSALAIAPLWVLGKKTRKSGSWGNAFLQINQSDRVRGRKPHYLIGYQTRSVKPVWLGGGGEIHEPRLWEKELSCLGLTKGNPANGKLLTLHSAPKYSCFVYAIRSGVLLEDIFWRPLDAKCIIFPWWEIGMNGSPVVLYVRFRKKAKHQQTPI